MAVYRLVRAVAKKDYTFVRVLLLYEHNVCGALFDGIQLYKEEFGQSYTYDSDGNIVSVRDLHQKSTTYEYANNNLTRAVASQRRAAGRIPMTTGMTSLRRKARRACAASFPSRRPRPQHERPRHDGRKRRAVDRVERDVTRRTATICSR